MIRKFVLCAGACLAMAASPAADACSRILYVGSDNSLRIVGRSLDWKTPIPTNLYVYPRGIPKIGSPDAGAVRWTSKYGAVYAVGYDGGVTEGMNEKGLVVNGLFCKNTVYNNDSTLNRPSMSLAVFVAWLLDMNATTPEVVDVLRKHDFSISGSTFDGGTVATLHWGITDAEGRCAILEFDHGKVKIYEGQDMTAMTNDPAYPQMTAINDYWTKIGGASMLPGTVTSPDRFVRGTYFGTHVVKTPDADLGLAICRSVLMNVSVPYGYAVESEPNVSSTQWRSFANLRDLRYYFDIVTNLGVFYIDLSECDLRQGAPVLKLDTAESSGFVGNVTERLVRSEPFKPMF